MPNKTFFNLDRVKQDSIIEAAVDEFANSDYTHAKVSHIIKQANIPRGSFYQYFEDKFDLYSYILKRIREEKLTYLSDTILNPKQIPFLQLFKELYTIGISFAIDNPKYVKISAHLLLNKDEVFDKIMKDNIKVAMDLYESMIDKDKAIGLIRPDIDSRLLAKIVYDMTANISIDSINKNDKTYNIEEMNKQINQVISIFEKGIK